MKHQIHDSPNFTNESKLMAFVPKHSRLSKQNFCMDWRYHAIKQGGTKMLFSNSCTHHTAKTKHQTSSSLLGGGNGVLGINDSQRKNHQTLPYLKMQVNSKNEVTWDYKNAEKVQ